MSSSSLKNEEEMDAQAVDENSLQDDETHLSDALLWQNEDEGAEDENILILDAEEAAVENLLDDNQCSRDATDGDQEQTGGFEILEQQPAHLTQSISSLPDLPDSTFIRKLFNKDAAQTSLNAQELEKIETPEVAKLPVTVPLENHDYKTLIAELNLAVSSLKNLEHIESLNAKIDALYDLNRILQLHEEALAPLQNLDKLGNLRFLDKLDGLKELASIQELKKLDNLSSLSHIEKISELSKLDNLSELRALSGLTELKALDKLDSLQKLDNLDKLDSLENLHLLDKLDETGFIEKVERLDRISLLNKKMHVIFLSQILGIFLELFKFACAAALVLYLMSSQIGQRFTTSALTATGFGSSAQTNLGLILLQGEVTEPQFSEIIENVRKKIKADYHRALSIDSRLSLGERVNIISEVLDYNYTYKGVSLQEETRQAVTQQVLYAKNLVISKIEFDIAIASNQDRQADVKKLKELKVLFLNGNYTQIIEDHKNSFEKIESVKMATIIATMEMYLKDPKTLQQLVIL